MKQMVKMNEVVRVFGFPDFVGCIVLLHLLFQDVSGDILLNVQEDEYLCSKNVFKSDFVAIWLQQNQAVNITLAYCHLLQQTRSPFGQKQ